MTTVYQAIGNITKALEGVGKNQRNREQNYNFRGIDDVLKELHPLLGEHGVFFAPDVIEREVEERVSKSGTHGSCVYLHVRYTVYGPEGDSFQLSTWGEGLDYGDKGHNKAMTAAFKYALFEVFAVSDPAEDADHASPEAGETVRRSAPASRRAPAETGETVTEKQLGMIVAQFNKKGFLDDKTARHGYVAAVIGREFAATSDLTKTEASTLIDALMAEDDYSGEPEFAYETRGGDDE